jgi:hypothetical protein
VASDLDVQRIRVASDCVNPMRCFRGEKIGPHSPTVQEIKDSRLGELAFLMLRLSTKEGNLMGHT